MKILNNEQRKSFDLRELQLFLEKLAIQIDKDPYNENNDFDELKNIFCEALSFALYFSKRGFKVYVYSSEILNEKEISESYIDYYDRTSFDNFIQDFEDSRILGAEFKNLDFSLNDFLEDKNSINIFLFNKTLEIEEQKISRIAVIKNDEDFLYIINPSQTDARDFLTIKRKNFEEIFNKHKKEIDVIVLKN